MVYKNEWLLYKQHNTHTRLQEYYKCVEFERGIVLNEGKDKVLSCSNF